MSKSKYARIQIPAFTSLWERKSGRHDIPLELYEKFTELAVAILVSESEQEKLPKIPEPVRTKPESFIYGGYVVERELSLGNLNASVELRYQVENPRDGSGFGLTLKVKFSREKDLQFTASHWEGFAPAAIEVIYSDSLEEQFQGFVDLAGNVFDSRAVVLD